MTRFTLFLIFYLISNAAFTQSGSAYLEAIRQWDRTRVENLKAENGWLNLTGLYFLPIGKTSFGSGEEAFIKFPAGTIPAVAGYFEVTDHSVNIITEKNISVTINGNAVQQALLFHNDSTSSPEVYYGTLKWNIIKRDDRFAIRLRNLQSEAVKNFKGIERYPADSSWLIKAVLRESVTPVFIPITNVLGKTSNQQSPGKLFFTISGTQYTLDALDGGKEELFIIFGDETNGLQTYPSGRYIYIKRPGADGVTYIDFNKSYNPPCAFTIYATCPLPPKQNILPVAITAGEKNYGDHK